MDDSSFFRRIFRFDGNRNDDSKRGTFNNDMDSFFSFGGIDDQFRRIHEEWQQILGDSFGPIDSMSPQYQESEDQPLWKQMLKPEMVPNIGEGNSPGIINDSEILDRDLDSEMITRGIVDLPRSGIIDVNPSYSPEERTGGFNYFSSFSSSSKRLANGKIEEQMTKRDSKGNQETTVTRRLGDETYIVKTIKKANGEEEKEETFNNTSPDEFMTKWQAQQQSQSGPDNHPYLALKESPEPFYKRILKNFF